jgi:hypothetical protein
VKSPFIQILETLYKKHKKAISFIIAVFLFFAGAILSDPIKDTWFRLTQKPSIDIFPSYYPDPYLNNSKVRIDIANTGERMIENISVKYRFCYMDSFAEITPHKKVLKDLESDYFEIVAKLNPQCSSYIQSPPINVSKDIYGNCYLLPFEVKSKVCTYCNLTIYVKADDFEKSYDYSYPYYEDEMIISINTTPINCSRYEYFNKGNVSITIADLSTDCLRNPDIYDWCQSNRFIK